MKLGRFIVDTHVHAQRHAAGPELRRKGVDNPEKPKYSDLGKTMPYLKTYDNSARLFYDMDCYDVDMCVLSSAFGMDNKLNAELVEKYPDKFVALCWAKETFDKAFNGEIEWTIDAAIEELDQLLATGKYVGIGEGMPKPASTYAGNTRENVKGTKFHTVTRNSRMDEMRKVMELARKHKVPVRYHTGAPMGYNIPYSSLPETYNPLWAHDIAAEFPDVPIVFDHGGMQGWWWEHFVDECLHVAASHDNVYLETGYFWTDLYYKALRDPNVGPEKLLWGTDWGASIPIYAQPGQYPPSYAVQLRKQGIIKYQVDVWGWSLKQLHRLEISQDDLNLILGGNAVRLYNIKFPLTRMFKPVD